MTNLVRHRLLRVLARESARRRSGRDPRMAGGLRRAGGRRRPRARHLPAAQAAGPRARAARAAAAGPQHAVQELGRARRPAAVSGQPRAREPHLLDRALERARHGGARQPRAPRARRPHRELRLGGRSVRSRLQPFLPRRRPGVLPAAFGARRVCERVPRRPAVARSSFDHYRRETGGKGLSSYCHPVPDAGVLAVPHRLDGPRAAQRDLPGALHALPRAPQDPESERRSARCGPSSATARWTSPSRSPACRSPRARASTT